MNKMSSFFTLLIVLVFATSLGSCKSMGKAALKHWTKKQRKEFVTKCQEGALMRLDENANEKCSCIALIFEEEFPKYEDAKAVTVTKMLARGKECL